MVQPVSNGSKGSYRSSSHLKDAYPDPINLRNLDVAEGSRESTGKKKIDMESGEEVSLPVNVHQTPERVRHLRTLWEQGARTVQRKYWPRHITGVNI